MCVCSCAILANHVSFIFQKKNVACEAMRRAVAATFTATANATASDLDSVSYLPPPTLALALCRGLIPSRSGGTTQSQCPDERRDPTGPLKLMTSPPPPPRLIIIKVRVRVKVCLKGRPTLGWETGRGFWQTRLAAAIGFGLCGPFAGL